MQSVKFAKGAVASTIVINGPYIFAIKYHTLRSFRRSCREGLRGDLGNGRPFEEGNTKRARRHFRDLSCLEDLYLLLLRLPLVPRSPVGPLFPTDRSLRWVLYLLSPRLHPYYPKVPYVPSDLAVRYFLSALQSLWGLYYPSPPLGLWGLLLPLLMQHLKH